MADAEKAPKDKPTKKGRAFIEPGDFDTLRMEELRQIAERRRAAEFAGPDADAAENGLPRDMVGLALSGGGIRSASLNLGVLQALHENGVLRHVDYLATVSGGGYIGACCSSEIAAQTGTIVADRDRFPLSAAPDRGQSDRVKKLLQAGHYLNRLLLLANQYFIGLAKLNLTGGSLLLAVCAFLALAWRFLDETPVCELILMLTGGTLFELVRPFLFTLVFLLAWVLGWGLSSAGPRHLRGSVFIGVGVELALITTVVAWRFLETGQGIDHQRASFGSFFTSLHPENPIWLFFRPLPFLLALAWPLAWVITVPSVPVQSTAPSKRTRLAVFVGVLAILAYCAWDFWTEPSPASAHDESFLALARSALRLLAPVLFIGVICLVSVFLLPWAVGEKVRASRRRRWAVLIGVPAAAIVAGLVWHGLERAGVPQESESYWWLLLRPAPFLLAMGWLIGWWLMACRSETPALDLN